MALAGAAQGMMALLIKPIFDRVLDPNPHPGHDASVRASHFSPPVVPGAIIPLQGRSVWTLVSIALLSVFLIKGLCDYWGII